MFEHKPLYFTRTLPEGIVNGYEVDPSIQLILHEAEKLGMSWEIVTDTDVIELTHQGITRSFRNRAPSTSFSPAAKICQNKQTTRVILKRAGLSVVPGLIIYKDDSDQRIESMWEALQKPLVLKPSHGTHGDGIEIGLEDFSSCLEKIRHYFKSPLYEGGMVLEEMFVGNEYRVMATRDKVIGVMERIPAYVVGDGMLTVQQLIEKENTNPLRNISVLLYPHIKLDETSYKLLEEQSLSLDAIPTKDQHVTLKRVSNVMAGGVAIDRTDEVHSSVKELALKAIQAIPGLSWAGIDFMTKDATLPQSPESYTIIEINPAPEFDMHDIPMQGKSREVAKEFLYLMFPELK